MTEEIVSSVLAGSRALVTGGSSGIGRAIALALARAGADVALTYRVSADAARDVRDRMRALGRNAVELRLDLSDENSIREVGPAARGALGGIDIWVNNAGADILTGDNASLPDIDKLRLLIEVDLRGTILASWEAAGMLSGGEDGVIINMSWDHVITGMPGRNPEMFAAVKGGVHAFSKSLARSLAPRVRVNVLAPGWIDTAFARQLGARRRREVRADTPLGRWGTPEDVANAAVFLASPAARFLTGQTIHVGGGAVMA